MMIRPIEYEREDTCPICNTKRSIEAYDNKNQSIRLSLSIDRKRDISNIPITYLKCRSCGEIFFPKWISKYPSPMNSSDFDLFMNGYINCVKDNGI